MRRTALMLALCSIAALPTAALAQSGATRSVDDYLCTFAGKCGEDAKDAVAVDDSIAAPDTKGMTLARRKAPAAASATQPAARSTTPAVSSRASRATTARSTRPSRMASSARATTRAPQGKRLDLRLTFMLNSAELTAQAKEEAKVFAKSLLMPELSGKKFLIEGHTDASGSRAINMSLSARRAAAVADFLASQGVPKSRLQVRGFGPDRPINGRTATSPENRRVEAVLL